jgi:hypothetical protein
MTEFIQLIESNIVAILTAFTGGNIVLAAATVLRTFSQRSLNRSFDLFKEGAKGLVDKNTTIEGAVRNFTGVITEVKGSIERLTVQVNNLDTTTMFDTLERTLRDLEVVKQALDYKDKLIEAYQKDLHSISIRLMQLEGKSGYPEVKVK